MIKSFKNGSKINYTYSSSGIVGISVSNNISGYIFSGSGANKLKNYLLELTNLNANVLTLSANCFNGCEHLQYVNLQNTGVATVGNNCFSNCGNLSAFIPSPNMTSIPSNCFSGDSKLKVFGKMSYENDNSRYD